MNPENVQLNSPQPVGTSTQGSLLDKRQRPLQDLRISVTDRCNFRCTYCMPKSVFGSSFQFMPHNELLSFEEITRLVKIFVQGGVRKVRLTGGEPLLRRDIDSLIRMLADVPQIEDIALTTNGSLLSEEMARKLKDAGLKRITISLDSLNDAEFQALNDVNFPLDRVLLAIDNAERAGLSPIKINMVVKRSVNDGSVLAMAEHFRGTPHIVRFIEFMDVGNTNGWRMEHVVSSSEILQSIDAHWPLEPIAPNRSGEVATRYRYKDGQGEIGVISSVTQAFCSTCTRLRLSSSGKLYTCLFANHGHDLRAMLRNGGTDEEVFAELKSIWGNRDDRYSELRTVITQTGKEKVEMSHIGG